MKSHLADCPAHLRKKRFEEWIEEIGDEVLAAKLKVSLQTIYHWKIGRCDPKVEQMRKIKRLTKGGMGYDQMIDRGRKILANNFHAKVRKLRRMA